MTKNFKNIYCGLLREPANPELGSYGAATDPNSGESVPNNTLKTDGTPLSGAVHTVPDDRGGAVQHGGVATASALQQANLLDNKLYRKIIEYHVRKYPFYTAVFTKATQVPWKGHKEAEYGEIGDIRTEARTKAAITGNANNSEVTLGSTILNLNDAAIFRPNYTIFVLGQKGYKEGTTTESNETLMLYVTGEADGYPKVRAINGPAISSGSSITYVPTIPAGSILRLGAPALAEEEVEVDGINVLPTMRTAYLQKKGYSVAITDFFNEAVKEVDFEKDRIRRQNLDAYKKVYTTTALFGAQKKFTKKNKNGIRYCYTQNGVLNQVRMAYELRDGKWTKGVLISIAKMLFTAYTDADEIELFCGSDAIEGILNIDWGNNCTQFTYLNDENFKVKVARFECTFGTLIFTHELALTENHLEKAVLAIPMADSIRLYRDNGSTHHVDGKKGETGNVEELVKDYFIQDDCFICNAMNSMLIGPSEIFSLGYTNGVKETFIHVDELPTAAAANVGKIYYLTTASANNAIGLWKCVSTGVDTYGYEQYSIDKTRV